MRINQERVGFALALPTLRSLLTLLPSVLPIFEHGDHYTYTLLR